MNLILYLSEAVIPILVLLIVGNGLMHRQHVYEDFLEGAKSGIRTAVEIMPTLIGLMAAVGILRASGFLDFISGWLGKLMAATGFPTELIPVAVVKMFSSSAATGLLLDIYKTHGADSMLGQICIKIMERIPISGFVRPSAWHAQRPFFIPCRFILCR